MNHIFRKFQFGLAILFVLGLCLPVQTARAATQDYSAWKDLGVVYPSSSEKAYYPSVIYDANGFGGGSPLYKMWYSNGSGGVFLTTSTNGVNWGAPSDAATGLGGYANHVQVLYNADCFGTSPCDAGTVKYKIWYWDTHANLYSISAIATAQSADGLIWTNETALTQSAADPLLAASGWNRGTYGPISLVYQAVASNTGTNPRNYSYAMYYDGTSGGTEETGLAYSADGRFWTAYAPTPVLARSGGTVWDANYATYGTVMHLGSAWVDWYSGGTSGANEGIGYASSPDSFTWTKNAGNPIFHISNGVSYRNGRVYTPSVINDGSGILKMYYTAVDTAGHYKIGLALLSYAPATVFVDDTWVGLSSPTQVTFPGDSKLHFIGIDAFATIQDGINAVSSGGTVNVAAGIYPEQLTISKSIHLIGSGIGSSIISAPASLPNSSQQTSAIIIISGSGVDTELTDFTVTGPGPSGCGSIRAGIFVRDNANANIHDNQIKDIRDSSFSGCQNGIAIAVGRQAWSTSGTATINYNTISGYQKGGIVVDNTGSNATIMKNNVTGAGTTDVIAQNGIQISRGATATLTGNTITGNSYHNIGNEADWGATGILIYQAGAVSLTGGNSVSGNDQNLDKTGSSGLLTLGAETLGSSTAPAGIGFDIVNEDSLPIDATGVTFTGAADGFAIEDLVQHKVDNATLGLVTWVAGNLYVTPLSGSIQAAIDAASAGDTVNVEAGTYNESLSISKPLTLRSSSGAASTIVNGGDPYSLMITSRDVTVDGFTITNPGYTGASDAAGIVVEPAPYATNAQIRITNNLIHDIGSPSRTSVAYGNCGINIGFADGVEIDHNEIYNIIHNDPNAWANGICIWGGGPDTPADHITIHHNLFHDISSPYFADAAISTQTDVGSVTVYNNSIISTPDNPTEYGVEVRSTNTVDAVHNWWGAASGPGSVGPGEGINLTTHVEYSPWCTNAACTTFAFLTTTSLEASESSSTYEAPVTFTATVTTGATGNVEFYNGETLIGTIALDAGTPNEAVLNYNALDVAGSPHIITAKYLGDSTHAGSKSSGLSQMVNKAPQTISIKKHAPANAAYDSGFSVAADGGDSGNPIVYSASGVCANSLADFTMTSGTGTCTVRYNQAGNANYKAATEATEDVSATKLDQTISITTHASVNAAYNSGFLVAANGGDSGNPIVYSASGVCTNSLADFTMTSGTGTCTVHYNQAGNANYNAATEVTEDVSATKLDQTISVTTHAPANAAYNSGFSVAAIGGASGNPIVYSSTGVCSNVGPAFTMTSGTGTCTVHFNQAGNTNYNAATEITESTTATKASQTILVTTHAATNAAYDSGFSVAANGGDSGNPIVYSASGVCSNVGPAFTMTSGTGTCTVRYNQAGNVNYNAAIEVTEDVSATKLDQTISITTHTPVNAAYNSGFSVAATGGASGNPIVYSSTGVCSNVGPAFTMTSGTGTCTVHYNQAGNVNYNAATEITESTTTTKASQTILVTTHAATNAAYNSGFSVAATGGASGNPIVYSSTGFCSNVGPAFTMTSGTGTCTVRYNQAGNVNYNAAIEVTESTTATRLAQTITFGALADKHLGDANFTVSASASSSLTVSFTTTTTTVCTFTADGTVHLAGQGLCTITASQSGNDNYNPAADVLQSFNVLAPVYHAPIITEGASTTANTSVNTQLNLLLHATDEDLNDTLTWSISSDGSHGTAIASGTGATKTIAYTPDQGYAGADNFVVKVMDSHGLFATITVNVTITAVEPSTYTIYLPIILR